MSSRMAAPLNRMCWEGLINKVCQQKPEVGVRGIECLGKSFRAEGIASINDDTAHRDLS